MSKPTITFRLSTYQLARGLQVIRSLEPNFQLTSLSQLVKIIYTDYLAKMTLGQSDLIDQSIMDEITDFITMPRRREFDLAAIADSEELSILNKLNQPVPPASEKTESEISSVTDFSPPKDWIDQEV